MERKQRVWPVFIALAIVGVLTVVNYVPAVHDRIAAVVDEYQYPDCPETHLLQFGSPSCGPCLQQKPTFLALAKEGWDVMYYDASDLINKGTFETFQVTKLPTFVVITDDSPNKVLFRCHSVHELKAWLKANNPPK